VGRSARVGGTTVIDTNVLNPRLAWGGRGTARGWALARAAAVV